MMDGHDVVGADEHVDFGGEGYARLRVEHREVENDEEVIVVVVDLGHLGGTEAVVQREGWKPYLSRSQSISSWVGGSMSTQARPACSKIRIFRPAGGSVKGYQSNLIAESQQASRPRSAPTVLPGEHLLQKRHAHEERVLGLPVKR